jgi:hypothetical protein
MLKAFAGILWIIKLFTEKYVIFFYLKYEGNGTLTQNIMCILLASEQYYVLTTIVVINKWAIGILWESKNWRCQRNDEVRCNIWAWIVKECLWKDREEYRRPSQVDNSRGVLFLSLIMPDKLQTSHLSFRFLPYYRIKELHDAESSRNCLKFS